MGVWKGSKEFHRSSHQHRELNSRTSKKEFIYRTEQTIFIQVWHIFGTQPTDVKAVSILLTCAYKKSSSLGKSQSFIG